jgi:hypothetical protein
MREENALRSRSPSNDSIRHSEILIFSEGLRQSNWATLTNIRTSSRFAMGVTLPFLEIRFQSSPSNQS